MAYGNTFEEVSKIEHPQRQETDYGFRIIAITEPDFSLKVFFLKNQWTGKFSFKKGVYFIEKGNLLIKNKLISQYEVLIVPKDSDFELEVKEDSLVYLFTSDDFSPHVRNANSISEHPKIPNEPKEFSEIETEFEIRDSFDKREKYWGKIESIISEKNFAGKKMFMHSETQSSLEYHVHKKECYFLQEGKLKVGLRVGRAENKSVTLLPGDVFIMYPGLMHMRICMENCIIIEISTKDEDSDSHLVEDGQTYRHREV